MRLIKKIERIVLKWQDTYDDRMIAEILNLFQTELLQNCDKCEDILSSEPHYCKKPTNKDVVKAAFEA